MSVHGAPDIDQDALGGFGDQDQLNIVGYIIDRDHAQETDNRRLQEITVGGGADQTVIDDYPDHQRHRNLGQRVNKYRHDGDGQRRKATEAQQQRALAETKRAEAQEQRAVALIEGARAAWSTGCARV